MPTSSHTQGVKNCIKAINVYKKRASYLQANKIFNTLIEYLYFMYEEYYNGLEYIEDVIIGIEQSNKEYYALAFIEFENLYACIPTPLLSPQAARYLLVHNHLIFTDKKEHNREHSFAPYTDEELDIIREAEKFLGICLSFSSNLDFYNEKVDVK